MQPNKGKKDLNKINNLHGPCAFSGPHTLSHMGAETVKNPQNLSDLKPSPNNPREMENEARDGLRASLEEFGDISGITYNRQTGHLVGGHQRVSVLSDIGATLEGDSIVLPNGDRFPVRVVDWSESKEERANIAANNPHIAGRFTQGLQSLLARAQESMPQERFEALRMDQLLDRMQDKPKADGPPPEPVDDAEPVCKTGDIWELGAHRLLCGDCTDRDAVSMLMGGHRADLCFTSPPYGLGDSVALRQKGKWADRDKSCYNGHDDTPSFQTRSGKRDDSWPRLMAGFVGVADAVVGCDYLCVNLQMVAGNKRALIDWLHSNRDRVADIMVWNKGFGAPASHQGVMNSAFEFLFILGADGADRRIRQASWHGTVPNVYSAPGNAGNEFSDKHKATMPVHLANHVLCDVFDGAQSVYEPFAGTGTTLVSAESLGKACYAVELSPAYCDVIIDRWQEQTGEVARRVYEGKETENHETERAANKADA